MEKQWYIQHGGRVVGPASSTQLKHLAAAGKISKSTLIKLGEDGEWTPASNVKGLWTQVALATPTIEEIAEQQLAAPIVRDTFPKVIDTSSRITATQVRSGDLASRNESSVPTSWSPHSIEHRASTSITTKPCMFCGEEIAQSAIKCRFCGEFLDGRPRETAQLAPQVIVTQNVGSHNSGDGSAVVLSQGSALSGFLSFLIPGLGQLCTGRPLAGIVWFLATIIGYAIFVIPGLVLHLVCIVDASKPGSFRIA